MINISAFTFRTSAKVKTAAAKLQKKFKFLNENFWLYNVLLQIDVHRDEKGRRICLDRSTVLNYMYRKGECRVIKFEELFDGKTPTKLDLENLAVVNEALLRNLGREWLKFGKGKTDYVYSAN